MEKNLEKLMSFVESRVKVIEEMQYPKDMAFDDIVVTVKRMRKTTPHN